MKPKYKIGDIVIDKMTGKRCKVLHIKGLVPHEVLTVTYGQGRVDLITCEIKEVSKMKKHKHNCVKCNQIFTCNSEMNIKDCIDFNEESALSCIDCYLDDNILAN